MERTDVVCPFRYKHDVLSKLIRRLDELQVLDKGETTGTVWDVRSPPRFIRTVSLQNTFIILFLGDLNTLFLFFFCILGSLMFHTNTALHLLLTAELL